MEVTPRRKNYSEYLYEQGAGYEMDEEALEDNTQKEYIADIFAEVSKSFGERFSATVGLKGSILSLTTPLAGKI